MVMCQNYKIYPDRRKIYRDWHEINLTTKEYALLYLLVVNKGHVLTYGQIYQDVWGEEALGNENNAVKFLSRPLNRENLQHLSKGKLKNIVINAIGLLSKSLYKDVASYFKTT